MTSLDATSTGIPVRRTAWGRLVDSQTAVDFAGRQWWGLAISGALLIATVVSLLFQGLNLGIDFEGGVSWDVPAETFTIDDAENVLSDNGLEVAEARLQERTSESGGFIKVDVGDQPEEVGATLRAAFAEAAGVPLDQVNVNLVSSSWGEEITDKAVRALLIFLAIVAVFISIRFEWRMAIASILAMIHDVLISVGIYSILQFLVTPPTVIAFLTILGYSLYDSIVVFDRIRENEARYASTKPPYDDVLNVSMNQVLMRSLNTSFASIVPVVSLLLVGAGILGEGTLAEFALALLVGMVTGAYSSIFIAVPVLRLLKRTDASWPKNLPRATGERLREMVIGGITGGRRARLRTPAGPEVEGGSGIGATTSSAVPGVADTVEHAKAALSHAPRPRKKTRR